MLEHSWVVDEWVQTGIRKGLEQGRKEGREEARQEIRTETLRRAVISALAVRFEVVPLDLLQTLGNISQSLTLDHLHQAAIRADSLDDFRRKLALVMGE